MSRAWDIADPSSMQDACHNELSKNMTSLATSHPVAQWLERLTGVRKVIGSIPVGDSDFSLFKP